MNWIKDINTDVLTSKQIKILLIGTLFLIALNISLSFLFHNITGQNLAGENLSESDSRNSFIRTNLYGAWIIGLVLASIISLIPFKGLSYGKKYVPFSIVTIFVLYVFIFVGALRIIILQS